MSARNRLAVRFFRWLRACWAEGRAIVDTSPLLAAIVALVDVGALYVLVLLAMEVE